MRRLFKASFARTNRTLVKSIGPEGQYSLGDELIIDQDHTSGGRNKKLIRAAAMSKGLVVNTMLTVVDRQQGGVENMRQEGVSLLSIYTADELLTYGLAAGFTTNIIFEQVQEYRLQNQL